MILLMSQAGATSRPFWQDLLLQGIGPLVAAVVGSLGAGVALSTWSSRRADRVNAYNRRIEMLEEMARSHGDFRAAIRVFVRAQETENDSESLALLRTEATGAYKRAIADFRVVESKLDFYFEDEAVVRAWHASADCLVVWYYLALHAGDDGILRTVREHHVGGEHSGLDLDALSDPERVIGESTARIREASVLVRTARLTVIGER